jgi:hypothetical protein
MVNEKKRRPKEGWRQLDFKTVICLPTKGCAAIFFSTLFLFSLILCSVILSQTYKIKHKESDYFSYPSNSSQTTIQITENLSSPVFVYYYLYDYQQNYRVYQKSRSSLQLSGQSDSALSTYCDPFYKNGDIDILVNSNDSSNVVHPCGIVALSFPNFTITAMNQNQTSIPILDDDISYPSDNSGKYKNSKYEYLNITDEHFKVWMRSAATKYPRKLYGRIEQDLKKGDNITFKMTQTNPNVLGFAPDLQILLSTTTKIGGKNLVLGWTFFVTMILSLVWGVFFTYVWWKDWKNPESQDQNLDSHS